MNQDLSQQQNVWCISLFSGDKYHNCKWKNYYENEPEEEVNPSPLGQFYNGTVVGVLLDMDRGFVSFFKDGIDLG